MKVIIGLFLLTVIVIAFVNVSTSNNSIPDTTPVPVTQSANQTSSYSGLGVTRQDLITKIRKGMPEMAFKEGTASEGNEIYVGQSEANVVQLKGTKTELTTITIVAVLGDKPEQNLRAVTFVSAVPNLLDEQAGDWTTKTLKEYADGFIGGSMKPQATTIDGKKYTLSSRDVSGLSGVQLVIEPSN